MGVKTSRVRTSTCSVCEHALAFLATPFQRPLKIHEREPLSLGTRVYYMALACTIYGQICTFRVCGG